MMESLPLRGRIYVWVILTSGVIGLCLAIGNEVWTPYTLDFSGPLNAYNSPVTLATLFCLVLISNAVVILVPEQGGERSRQSLNAVGGLACASVLPVQIAFLVVAAATLFEQLRAQAAYGSRPLYRKFFNVVIAALATGAAAGVLTEAGGRALLLHPALPWQAPVLLMIVLGAVSVAYVVAYGLTITAVSLSSGVSIVQLFFKSHRPTILPEATSGVVGIFFGYFWLKDPALCPIVLLPLAVIFLAFRNFIRLQEVDRLKSNFMTEVSHELRTPLAAIVASSELLYHGVDDLEQAQVKTLSRTTYESSNHLFRLVENLLNATTLQSGTLHIRPVPMSADEIIAIATTQIEPFIESKGQCLCIDIPHDLPEVMADPNHIVQVLINLLTNASKYSSESTEVTVSCRESDGFVTFEVRDQGIGISKEEQAHVFDRFYRAPSRTMTSVVGSGLGLSIVKSLVELHGGRLGLASSPGKGSLFWFTLPQAKQYSEL
jgi:signal transduction histidine kinase